MSSLFEPPLTVTLTCGDELAKWVLSPLYWASHLAVT